MHKNNQDLFNIDQAIAPIVGKIELSQPGFFPWHQHARHQLSYAITGVLHTSTTNGEWVLPPSRALWISAGISHAILVKRSADIRTLYINPIIYPNPHENDCVVVEVTPLVRELILTCSALPWDYTLQSAQGRLSQVLIDQFRTLDHTPTDILLPQDSRALNIANILRSEPANREPLAILASRVGASPRTIERLFVQETTMSFGVWRQRQRLIFALELLAYGESVQNAAWETGYESSSSFVFAFRSMFGKTPAQYFK